MKTSTRRYFVMVPASFSHSGKSYWQELSGIKTLTSAQHFADQFFMGLPDPEIGVSLNDEAIEVTSRKNAGKWLVVYEESKKHK